MKFLDAMLCLIASVGVFAWATMKGPTPPEEALLAQTTLINLGEAALYFAGAVLLFYAARCAEEYAVLIQTQTARRGQDLEFICRQFEDRYSERCKADPRGPKA